jgi:hypothetical protein
MMIKVAASRKSPWTGNIKSIGDDNGDRIEDFLARLIRRQSTQFPRRFQLYCRASCFVETLLAKEPRESLGDHTRPRVLSLAPSPKIGVAGDRTKFSTRASKTTCEGACAPLECLAPPEPFPQIIMRGSIDAAFDEHSTAGKHSETGDNTRMTF